MTTTKTLKWKLAQSIELKWWKNYLADKNSTDYLVWKKQYWQTILNRIADVVAFNETAEVLDCGCGPAGVFIALSNKIKITAEDPLLDAFEKALPHFKKSMYPNVDFYAVPLEDFNVEKKFDVVFCMNAINHVSDINFCYDKICSLVKSGGKLIITIDAHNHQTLKYLFRLVPGDILHPHQFDLTEYNLFLEKRGMKILKTEQLKKEFFFNHYLQVAEKI